MLKVNEEHTPPFVLLATPVLLEVSHHAVAFLQLHLVTLLFVFALVAFLLHLQAALLSLGGALRGPRLLARYRVQRVPLRG